MISPATLIFSVIILVAFAAFIAYGSGFHHGHVSGFHEGMDVAKDDIAAINADHTRWRTRREKPRFPCELIIAMEYEPGKTVLRIQDFEDEAQWNEYLKLVDDTMLWYDVVRIAPRMS
jgi:hypothetical protein